MMKRYWLMSVISFALLASGIGFAAVVAAQDKTRAAAATTGRRRAHPA